MIAMLFPLLIVLAIMGLVVLVAIVIARWLDARSRCDKYPECCCREGEECFTKQFEKRAKRFGVGHDLRKGNDEWNPPPRNDGRRDVSNVGMYIPPDGISGIQKFGIAQDCQWGTMPPEHNPLNWTDEQIDRLIVAALNEPDPDLAHVEQTEPSRLDPPPEPSGPSDNPPTDTGFSTSGW